MAQFQASWPYSCHWGLHPPTEGQTPQHLGVCSMKHMRIVRLCGESLDLKSDLHLFMRENPLSHMAVLGGSTVADP